MATEMPVVRAKTRGIPGAAFCRSGSLEESVSAEVGVTSTQAVEVNVMVLPPPSMTLTKVVLTGLDVGSSVVTVPSSMALVPSSSFSVVALVVEVVDSVEVGSVTTC